MSSEATTHPPSPAAYAVDPDRFTKVEVLQDWLERLDRRGLRATGSPEHADYVDDLARRLREAGVADVWLEPVPMRRWTPRHWGLEVVDADGVRRDVPTVSAVAYSGETGTDGVTGVLATEPGPGCIGLVDIAQVSMAASDFDALDWDAPDVATHGADWDPSLRYERIWLSQDLMREALEEYAAAGAAGLVLVVDLPEEQITGAYLLYDAVRRGIPAVFVGRRTGQQLRDAHASGATARLTLEADVDDVVTHNVVGMIPGVSEELVVLQSHTDGPNALEDNGPEAIVAMATHLADLPEGSLERGVLVVLSTGHFAIEEAWGLERFLERHRDFLVPRIAAVLSLEHLGARARAEDYPDGIALPEHEFGCCFATPHRAMVDVVRKAMARAQVADPVVLRPFVPDTTGNSPDGTTWPADGGPFWHTAGLPTANFITGPNYLFNVEPVIDLIDVGALRRQAIAFTEATLALAATPWDDLRAPIGGGVR